MLRREYWEPLDLLDYVMRVWQGRGRVEEVKDDSTERRRFVDRAWQAFADQGYPIHRIRTWVNVMEPKEGSEWDDGYPHVHHDETALTLIHYVQTSDVPTPLFILHDEMIVETIYPDENLTVFVPNGVKHGVRRNNGTRNRVAMISTAYQ